MDWTIVAIAFYVGGCVMYFCLCLTFPKRRIYPAWVRFYAYALSALIWPVGLVYFYYSAKKEPTFGLEVCPSCGACQFCTHAEKCHLCSYKKEKIYDSLGEFHDDVLK